MHMGKFALLCQGARLLGQVLHYVSNPEAVDNESWMQLDRTLEAMITASLNVDRPDPDQIAFLYRYVLLLFLEQLLISAMQLARGAIYTMAWPA
jgi:hypothetical protein